MEEIILKILSPKGNLLSVERVARVCEKRIDFNGEYRDLYEVAKNSSVSATGLAFKVVSEPMGFVVQELYVGNLKPELVNEIMTELLVVGYYDFTQMEFQTTKCERKLVLDGGATLPFSSDITNCVMNRRNFTSEMDIVCTGNVFSPYTFFGSQDWSAASAFDDSEEDEEDVNEDE